MKKIISYIYIPLMAAAVLLSGCDSEDKLRVSDDLLGLGGEVWEKTETDNWIYDNYTRPYNIEIKYKWDKYEVDQNYQFTPMDEKKVMPLLAAIKRIWIEPYEATGGADFIKKYAFRKFILIGSHKYNASGGPVNGEAEGGRKVVLYRLNWFTSAKDTGLLRDILKTVHHEYAHILDQTKNLPPEWQLVTETGYTSSWNQSAETDDIAIQLGYISRYARATPAEDFAEMLSIICTRGREWFNNRVAKAQEFFDNPTIGRNLRYNPADALREKEAIVIDYLDKNWKVNLYDVADGKMGLESLVQRSFTELAEEL